jgi:hypothetical protein
MLREEATGEPMKQTAAAGAQHSPESVSKNNGQDPMQGRHASSYIGLNDEPIHSRLKGPVSGWEPGTVFELENGQQWKVLKGKMKLRQTRQSPEIVVVPGCGWPLVPAGRRGHAQGACLSDRLTGACLRYREPINGPSSS